MGIVSILKQILFIAACLACMGQRSIRAEDDAHYLSHVKPLLSKRCYACHGALKQEGGLRLDTVALILRGGDSGEVLAPGTPDSSSLLIMRVSETEPDQRMPPEHEGEALTAAEIAILQEWIAAGATGPAEEEPEADPKDHWAFRPVARPSPPSVENSGWVKNPTDAWIAAGHQGQNLVPQPEAPRAVLLRRLMIDLIGLPPTADEIAACLSDTSSDWYERTVDRLLDDPRHGERWARHWMDIWRYSDWWGLGAELRNSQRHIWRWRDWIVQSLNEDAPYDEMIRLMLAADELAPDDPDKFRATGFLARNFFMYNRTQWMDQTVEHVGKGFLGLTMNCAKCHDHKFDPIEQADYYRMRAFFEPYQVRVDMVPGEVDLVRDGIPRVFDGLLETPTYLFIRGDEALPDSSQSIAPGVPELLTFEKLSIEPITLPEFAWRPELRPWVFENHINATKRRLEAAEKKRDELQTTDGEPSQEYELAEAEANVAQAEWLSVERRATAILAQAEDSDPGTQAEAHMAAIRAERQLEVERAKRELVMSHHALKGAEESKREDAEKTVASAEESLQKATDLLQAEILPTDTFSPLNGAQWSATRFQDTTRDDPMVSFPQVSTGRRTALARWITDRRNPLTARAAVNHLWNRHFGTPLAPAPFDLGRNSPRPVHGELIDWLAAELMDHRWSMKHLHRLIVTSSTYRMSSSQADAEENIAKDTDNQYWWRRSPIRIESQVVRDSILSLAGTLDPTMGGPTIPPNEQETSKRRSLYFFHSNNDRSLFLTMFDEADVTECYRREQSIVPQQALALTNSGLVLEASTQIADRIGQERSDDADFAREAFLMVLGIEAGDAEIAASLNALDHWKQLADGSASQARSNLIWILLNHNDFVTLR